MPTQDEDPVPHNEGGGTPVASQHRYAPGTHNIFWGGYVRKKK